MKKLFYFLIFSLSHLSASAQSDDFGLDFSLEAQKKLSKQWSISLEGEYRSRNNAKTNDRWSIGLGVDYTVLEGDAEVGDPKKCAQYWGTRHRFNVSLTASQKWGDFKFSLRERWQYTYRPEYTVDERWSYLDQAYDGKQHIYSGKGKNVLRSRLQVEYSKKKLPVTPYANVEFFNAWSLQKTRFTAGLDWDISKQWSISLEGEYRSRNNAKTNDRWSIGLGVDYIKF